MAVQGVPSVHPFPSPTPQPSPGRTTNCRLPSAPEWDPTARHRPWDVHGMPARMSGRSTRATRKCGEVGSPKKGSWGGGCERQLTGLTDRPARLQ